MIVARPRLLHSGLALLLSLVIAAPVLAAHGLQFDTPVQGSVTDLGYLQSFHTTITNTGDQADTYTVIITRNMPGDWVGSLCEGTICYPPFISQITVSLDAGASTQVDVDMTPIDLEGYGSCAVQVTSDGNPSLTDTATFSVVSSGLEVLLVVDDTHGDLTPYYTAALNSTGKSYGVWKQVEMGDLTNLDLMNFSTVVWSAGELSGALGSNDFSALAYYVQHGGNLFLNGRDLAYESCDPGSPHYSASNKAWFNYILGVDYAGPVASHYASARQAGNCPIAQGLDLTLSGGDGADNTHLTLDGLATSNVGIASLEYYDADAGGLAAIKSTYGSGRSYFAGFAFEAIDNAADRSTLMQRVLGWFAGDVNAVDDQPVHPLLAAPARAVPNPFNPRTSVRFEVGGAGAVNARVAVYDIRGQLVRRLLDGQVQPGPQSLAWDGRDDQGRALATGVYLARIQLDGQDAGSTKMTLTK